MRRLLLVLLTGVAVVALPAAASAKVRVGPAGLAFYKPPTHLPGSGHGALIWARPLKGTAALPGARNELVLYRSVSLSGRPIAVSGIVSVPTGRPPKGGWPIITYAHATTGIGDACTPSRDSPTSPAHAYIAYAYPLLDSWIKAGYAVMRTDYEGLGTPGAHPYLVGESEGRGTLDIVTAARQLYPSLSRRVVITGHSQGGQGALYAAAIAAHWTPKLRVLGTVAFAPVSHLSEQAAAIGSLNSPSPGLSALAALILRGISTVDPGLNVFGLLSPAAQALWPQTLTLCDPQLQQSNSFGSLTPSQVLASGANVTPFEAALTRFEDPENLLIKTPVLVEQGEADTTVFPVFTNELDQEYVQHGVPVTYHTYPGVTHGGIVVSAASDATSWIGARFGRGG